MWTLLHLLTIASVGRQPFNYEWTFTELQLIIHQYKEWNRSLGVIRLTGNSRPHHDYAPRLHLVINDVPQVHLLKPFATWTAYAIQRKVCHYPHALRLYCFTCKSNSPKSKNDVQYVHVRRTLKYYLWSPLSKGVYFQTGTCVRNISIFLSQ